MTEKITKKKTAYAIMWMTVDHDDGLLSHTLTYGSPGRPVRTYYQGHLDDRAGDEESLPRFDDLHSAMGFFSEHLRSGSRETPKALLAVSVAKQIRPDTYADPV